MALLTIREAARLLSVHENTIRNWCNEGRITPVRLPGSRHFRRIPEEEVDRLLSNMGTVQLRLW